MQKNIAFRYAFIALFVAIVWTMIEHFLGFNTTDHETGQYARMITPLIFFALVFLAVREVKNKMGETFRFSDGLSTGTILSLLYAFGLSIWYAVYGELINPEFQSSLLAFEKKKMIAANLSEARIAEKLKEMELSSGGSLLSYFILFLVMFLFGVVIAVIATIILRKKRHPHEVLKGSAEMMR